jgi:C4-dicarboxylate transporter/malic acid transport protein
VHAQAMTSWWSTVLAAQSWVMSIVHAGSGGAPPTDGAHRGSFLADLQGEPVLGFFGPNWFASVMGTGIVANAAATLPVDLPWLLTFARGVWLLDAVLLLVVVAATVVHRTRHPTTARGHLDDPVMSHFYGAPAMALMTVGAGALLVGRPVVGTTAAVWLDALLWTAGTAIGLWSAVAVPYKAFTTHEVEPRSAFGGWLMPVVPPMVSAATGALLVPHLPAGQWQLTMQLACYAMFGLTLVASLVVITLIWGRLVQHKIGAAAAVPTLWIVLGPLGQSVTAAHTLGATSTAVLPAPYGLAFTAMGLVFGVPMWGFAMLWLALAVVITARTARRGLPFSLTWWSFTFPVGTVVTGTSGLAAATGANVLAVAAAVFYVGLLVAWGTVAVRTGHGVYRGRLLRAPA